MLEQDLLWRLKEADERFDRAQAELKEAEATVEWLQASIAELLIDKNAKTTAKYDGIGSVTLLKPLVRAEYDKNYQAELFTFVKDKGEESIIKTDIPWQSLGGFVGRILDTGQCTPGFITYWFKQSIRRNFSK